MGWPGRIGDRACSCVCRILAANAGLGGTTGRCGGGPTTPGARFAPPLPAGLAGLTDGRGGGAIGEPGVTTTAAGGVASRAGCGGRGIEGAAGVGIRGTPGVAATGRTRSAGNGCRGPDSTCPGRGALVDVSGRPGAAGRGNSGRTGASGRASGTPGVAATGADVGGTTGRTTGRTGSGAGRLPTMLAAGMAAPSVAPGAEATEAGFPGATTLAGGAAMGAGPVGREAVSGILPGSALPEGDAEELAAGCPASGGWIGPPPDSGGLKGNADARGKGDGSGAFSARGPALTGSAVVGAGTTGGGSGSRGAGPTAGCSAASGRAGSPVDTSWPKCFRTSRAMLSSIELECVFFSVTPNCGSTSRTALFGTSSSRASSLMRIMLSCVRRLGGFPLRLVGPFGDHRSRLASGFRGVRFFRHTCALLIQHRGGRPIQIPFATRTRRR